MMMFSKKKPCVLVRGWMLKGEEETILERNELEEGDKCGSECWGRRGNNG
jgi:hypothetical protein